MKVLSQIIDDKDIVNKKYVDDKSIAVKHIDVTDNTQWDSEHEQPTQSVLQDIAINEYHVLSVENVPTGEQGDTLGVKVYLATKFDGSDIHLRQYIRFEEGDPEEGDPTGIQTFTIGNINPEQPTVYQFIADTTPFTTDVQINGTSIVDDSVANLVTNTAYDASSNKIATMSDVENSVDLSSYSAGDTISDSTIVAKLKKDNIVVTNDTSKYRLVDHSNGTYLYTVMNQLDGGDYILLAESGDNLIVYQKDSTYWQLRIDANNKLSADLISDGNTNKTVTSTEKSMWNGKQDALVSGTNIKTVNNNSLLGAGNLSLVEGTVVVSNTEPSDPNAEVWIDTSEPGVIESKFKNKTWQSKAHRGNVVGHEDTLRENTLGAYYNAFLKGADVIEVDARLSSDNVFMCNHDTTVTDINEVTYTIANTPAATLQALVLSTDSVYGNQGVPTLESVLKLAYTCGMKVDVDLKMFDSGMSDSQKRTFASNVAKLVAKCGMKGRATYAIVNAGALVIPEIIAIDPEASFITTKANLDAISNLSTILPNYKDKCYAYTADLTASTVDAIRNAGYRLELISITADNFSEAIQFYPDNLEYLHTTDFRTIEDAYFNSVILY